MDRRIQLDQIVLSRAKSQLVESHAALAQPIGQLAETLRARGRPGQPSDLERLIGAAITEALQGRHVAVDGVFHGVFDERNDFVAGPKTFNDTWSVLPYENYLVTAKLAPEEIKTVMEEAYDSHEGRNLMGFDITTERRGTEHRIKSITLAGGRPLGRDKKYTIAFNTFDSRSGGHRFMKLRALLETSAASCQFHPVQTRDALIDYFRRHQIVHKIAGATRLAVAA
jgi:2',3'-cyclic-nucleotide 2'-phosphodiesterase (5'-nucleotidase family)